MKTTALKNCHCFTCGKDYHYLGISRHRAMHRDKREDCEISYTNGDVYVDKFSERPLVSGRANQKSNVK